MQVELFDFTRSGIAGAPWNTQRQFDGASQKQLIWKKDPAFQTVGVKLYRIDCDGVLMCCGI